MLLSAIWQSPVLLADPLLEMEFRVSEILFPLAADPIEGDAVYVVCAKQSDNVPVLNNRNITRYFAKLSCCVTMFFEPIVVFMYLTNLTAMLKSRFGF